MRALPNSVFVVSLGLLTGCGSTTDDDSPFGPAASGGAASAGGASIGGAIVQGSGGAPASGGAGVTGGTTAGGGSIATGGVAGAPAGASGATGGVPVDPNATFDWPEATSHQGACQPGKYVGRFSCNMTLIPGIPPGVVEGPVTFTLEPSENGEFLEIKNGRLDATANDTIPFGCDLVGKLDCSTRAFAATAENGSYGTPPFSGVFFGDMNGTLDGLGSTLAGSWSLAPGTAGMPLTNPCDGPWSAVLAP
jgi:hypothetical protein